MLFLAPQPFFADRGSPLRVRSTVTALTELGAHVDLLVFPFGDSISLERLTIHRSPRLPGFSEPSIGPSWSKIGFDALLFLKAAQLIKKNSYDAIHGVEEAAFLAGVLSKFSKIPYVFDLHSWMSEQISDRGFIRNRTILAFFERLETRCLQKSSGIITVGEVMTARAKQIAPEVPGVSLEDLPLTCFSPVTSEQVDQLRKEHGLEGKRVLLYTGNFVPYQGIDLLLSGYRHFLDTHSGQLPSPTHLLIVGGGEASDPTRQKYEALANQLGLQNDLTFVGQKPVAEMGMYYALAEAFVSPRVDGTNPPLKIYSYMAAGKIIVATRMSSHTQILSDDAALLTPLTPAGLARGIFDALHEDGQNQQLNHRRISRARQLVETEYSPDAFREKLGRIYGHVLGFPSQSSNPADLSELGPEPRRLVNVR